MQYERDRVSITIDYIFQGENYRARVEISPEVIEDARQSVSSNEIIAMSAVQLWKKIQHEVFK